MGFPEFVSVTPEKIAQLMQGTTQGHQEGDVTLSVWGPDWVRFKAAVGYEPSFDPIVLTMPEK